MKQQTGGLKGALKSLRSKSVTIVPSDTVDVAKPCNKGNDNYSNEMIDRAKQDVLFYQIQNQYAQFLYHEVKDIQKETNSTRIVRNHIKRIDKDAWKANVNVPCQYKLCGAAAP